MNLATIHLKLHHQHFFFFSLNTVTKLVEHNIPHLLPLNIWTISGIGEIIRLDSSSAIQLPEETDQIILMIGDSIKISNQKYEKYMTNLEAYTEYYVKNLSKVTIKRKQLYSRKD